MKYYSKTLKKYVDLPEYSFGGWAKKNAGTIGTVAGLGLGAALAPFTGGLSLAAGASLGASAGGAIGGAVEKDYQADQQAELQEEQLNEQQLNTKIQNQRNKLNNGFQSRMFSGTNNFAYGGKMTPKNPVSVGEVKHPDKNLSIPYKRVPELIQAKIFGDSANEPWEKYLEAVERNLTPTTQGFIYDRSGTKNPYEAAIKETLKSSPSEFFDVNNTGINRLIPTKDIDLSRAIEAKQFLADMYGRGQIKYKFGGSMGYANGGNIENYSGQRHSGPNGGIPVTSDGTPSVINGKQPSALVEDGEVSWTDPETGEVYIFSNRIKV